MPRIDRTRPAIATGAVLALMFADSESESVAKSHDGGKRGIRIGSARDGSVTAFIPDPVEKAITTSAVEASRPTRPASSTVPRWGRSG